MPRRSYIVVGLDFDNGIAALKSAVDSILAHNLSIIYDKFMDEWVVM